MSSDIFISYAHEDKNEKWFEELIQQFESLDIPFWIDKDIQGGQKWREEINSAIQAASIYVLIITPAL
jgi:TIR domain.